MNLEGDTLLKIQKWWYAILYAFRQSLSTNKSCTPYKYLRAENHNIYYLLLPPDTHHKFSTAKEIYEALSRALRVYIVEGNTISSSKEPTSYVKLIAYINNYNGLDLIFFSVSPQLGRLGPKAQDLVIYFSLVEEETLPRFHLRDIHIRNEKFLLQDETGQINNLIGKYTMELSKLKHLQWYMTTFELYYRRFERLPQRHKISTIFYSTIEEFFETLKTAYIDITTAHSIIESIVNRDFGNKFQHQNGPNQCQHIHKNTSQ